MNVKKFKQNILPLGNRIFPMALRLLGNNCDAEDLVQEVMLKLWHNRYKIENHKNITGYVLLIARNACFDKLKKRKTEWKYQQKHCDNWFNTDKIYDNNEAVKLVLQIVEKMPKQEKMVLQLRDFDGFELADIAESMQIKETYVRVLLSRARKKVRAEMVKIYNYEQH